MIDVDRKIRYVDRQREQSARYYKKHHSERLMYQADYRRAQREGVFAPARVHKPPRKRKGRYSSKRQKKSS